MVLEHIAAILLFSGPLFYIGLWMAIDPAGIGSLPEMLLRGLGKLVQRLGGPDLHAIPHAEYTDSRKVRRIVRFTGVALLLFAIVV
jgi:hypothetical protein